MYSGLWSFCEISIGIVAACLPTFAILFSKSHFLSISASARRLLSTTFSRRSRRSDTEASTSGAGVLEGGDDHAVQMFSWPLAGQENSFSNNIRKSSGDESTFAASNASERGEWGEHEAGGIKVKNEVLQTRQ